nr:ABC transporter permease [Bifidobacterium pullorum]
MTMAIDRISRRPVAGGHHSTTGLPGPYAALRRAGRRLRRRVPTIVAVAVLLGGWQAWVTLGHVDPAIIAAPTDIIRAIAGTWGTLGAAAAVTGFEGTVGFLFAVALGVLVGVGLHCSKVFEAACYPLLAAAQTLPLISIAPLFLIWFGFEIPGKIVITAVFGLFPVAVQTVRGLDAVPRYFSDVALTCGASRAWTLWHVKLRVAARQIYGGVRVTAAYVFATASTAEYLGARQGMGIWLQAAYNSFSTPLVFAATVVIVLMTCALLLVVNLSERLLLGPAADEEDPDADQ